MGGEGGWRMWVGVRVDRLGWEDIVDVRRDQNGVG